jgi:hypothetical protein
MSRGRQRTLFSVGRRFPYAMARDFSPIEALACFLFGPTRKLTHAFALEAARRKIERRSCAGNAGGEAQRMQKACKKVTSSRVTCLQYLSLPVFCHAPICGLARVFTVRTVLVRKPQALPSRAVRTPPHVVETRRVENQRSLFPLRDIQAKREGANFPVRPSASHPMTMGRWRVRLAAHKGCKIVGMASVKVRERPNHRLDRRCSGRQLTWQSRTCG